MADISVCPEARRTFNGHHHTEEAKQKIRDKLKGKKRDLEVCKKISEGKVKGWEKRKLSDEERKKRKCEWSKKYRESHKEQILKHNKEWKKNNRDKLREGSNKRNKRVAKSNKTMLIEAYDGECLLCGYKFTGNNQAAFDFHHVNPEEKDHNIVMSASMDTIIKEVIKCVLVCSNCHRILHSQED